MDAGVDRLRIRADCVPTLRWCVSQEPWSTSLNNCPLVAEGSFLTANECDPTRGYQTVTALSRRHELHSPRISSFLLIQLPDAACPG